MNRTSKLLIAGVSALLLVALASPGHRASIRIFTHAEEDRAPQKMQAVVDLGLVAVSVLVTWSKRLTL